MESLSDEELIAEYRRLGGAPEAAAYINELFRRHYGKVGLWCYRITGERDSAADLAQEVFTRVFQNLAAFRGGSKFTTWLYSVTRNHCHNAVQTAYAKAAQRAVPIDDQPGLASDQNIHKALETAERIEVARRLMGSALDEVETQVMTLHYADGMPLDAITRLLGLRNASGAKAYVVSARRKLAAALDRWKGGKGHGEPS